MTSRDNKKGRAKGGIIVAISREIKGEIKVKEINKDMIEISFVYNKNKWRIFTIYSWDIEEILKIMMEKVGRLFNNRRKFQHENK